MKIAHVIRALDVGGAERVTAEIASAFAEAGDEVTIFAGWATDAGSPAQKRLSPKVRVEYLQEREYSRGLNYWAAAVWIWRNRRRLSGFDVIHCHLTYGAYVATLVGAYRAASNQRRPRIVETYHSVGAPISPRVRWLHARMAARRDVLVLMAEDSFWRRFAAAHRRMTVTTILNGATTPDVSVLDDRARREYREQLGIPEDAPFIVGSIGMLRADRQPRVFVPVIAALVRELDAHWIFAGDGPERAELERLIADAGIARNVHFAGVVTDVRYPLSLMALNFTITVGAVGGVAAIEAALAGVPVVGFQLSADYEARGNEWIWSSNRVDAIIGTALRLLRDPHERRALAERQQHYARTHHSIERMVRSYRDVYTTGENHQGDVIS